MAEVINLSDDDDIVVEDSINPLAEASKAVPRCLNAECRTQDNLKRAPLDVKRFYGVLAYPKKTRACLHCIARVNLHKRNLVASLKSGKTFLAEMVTTPVRDTVLLTDSESDPEDSTRPSSESEVEMSLSDDSKDSDASACSLSVKSTKKIKLLLEDMIDSLDLKKHVSDSISNVTGRLLKAEKDFEELNIEYKNIENDINSVRVEFYDAFKPKVKMLPELDVDKAPVDEQFDVLQSAQVKCQASLPPIGTLVRPMLKPQQLVYAMKHSLFARWVPAMVLNVSKCEPNNTRYTIRYNRNIQINPPRELTGRQLAYEDPCKTRLMVGTRVIARYKDDQTTSAKSDVSAMGNFYVGIVAEVPTVANKYKYLIFFDDGYAQYVLHQDIRVVTEASIYPWEDVCSDSREFIKEYVQMYPERPMVRLQKWNTVKTEWNGKWWRAQVMEVEGSLVKMYFPTDGRTEWIYRGSTRLSPLFHKKMNIQANAEQATRFTARRRTVPNRQIGHVVEYGTFGQGNTLDNSMSQSNTSSQFNLSTSEIETAVKQAAAVAAARLSLPNTAPTPLLYNTLTSFGSDALQALSQQQSANNPSLLLQAQQQQQQSTLSTTAVTPSSVAAANIASAVVPSQSATANLNVSPKVSATENSNISKPASASGAALTASSPAAASAPPTANRSVAKKSTMARPGTPPPELIEKMQLEKTGYIRKAQIPPLNRQFRPHQCNPTCVGGAKGEELLKRNRNISPLLIPIVLGWRRQIVKQRKKSVSRKSIYYVAPCCRRLRSIDELFVYLRTTHSKLEVDFFSFELNIDVINEWAPHKELFTMSDLSGGIEPMPISVVNSLDNEPPQPLQYCNVRKPAPEVPLNLDPKFLVCCSCTDDCQDKTRCECWQLTLQSNESMPPGLQLTEPGYLHRRLYEQVPTGIFECNSRCSCNNTCQNRVVQNPLRLKLQLFKTARRGWGVRTLHDVPRGSFLCVYVGRMITDNVANQEGKISGGDDYYAELDYIEVVEERKEGYEEDVEHEEGDFPETQQKKPTVTREKETALEKEASDEELQYQETDREDGNFTVNLKSQRLSERQPSSRLQAKAENRKKFNIAGESSDEDPDDPSPVGSNTNSRATSPHPASTDKQSHDEEDEDEGDEKQRARQHFSALIPDTLTSPKKKSLRDYFGKDEQVYIMDAKKTGNIGRYLNHSCQPNVFVQNVFVDSQDLRFPYMSFFAVTSIRAGQELTWDYAYEVGSVTGKVKYCYCGAKKCRGRLL